MRKWGPFVLLAVALGGLFIWSQCGASTDGHDEFAVVDLYPIAVEHIGGVPEDVPWAGAELSFFDESSLSDGARRMLDQAAYGGDFAEFADDKSLAEVEGALSQRGSNGSGSLLSYLRGRVAMARAQLALGEYRGMFALGTALSDSARALNTSRTLQQWEDSHAARVFVLQAVSACLAGEGKRVALTDLRSFGAAFAEHRTSLGHVLARAFLDSTLPQIAEASGLPSASAAASFGLSGESDPEQVELIAALLRGHPRSFSPEATVQAGAASVRELREALKGPWPGARAVLDRAREAQKFWTDFLAMMEMDENEAVAKVRELRERGSRIENPVGLALLHDSRVSWPGLVQSAYVADAREAAFTAFLLGHSSLTDPISGEQAQVVGGEVRFKSSGDDSEYPFIRALVSEPVRVGPDQPDR